MFISSKENPRIKQYIKLSASKKARDESGLFVVEGARGCTDIAESAELEAVFYTEKAWDRYSKTLDMNALERVDAEKRHIITDEVADRMSSVDNTQGMFAIAHRLDKPFCVEALSSSGRYLVTVNLQDPGNLGTMLRTAAAVGLDGVIMTDNTVDLYNPKVVRSAMGSMPYIDLFIERNVQTALDVLHYASVKTCAAVVSGGKNAREFDFSGGCAVVIGNEGRGLSDSVTAECDEKITIQMRGNVQSLNAAIAGTILLWEMSKGE